MKSLLILTILAFSHADGSASPGEGAEGAHLERESYQRSHCSPSNQSSCEAGFDKIKASERSLARQAATLRDRALEQKSKLESKRKLVKAEIRHQESMRATAYETGKTAFRNRESLKTMSTGMKAIQDSLLKTERELGDQIPRLILALQNHFRYTGATIHQEINEIELEIARRKKEKRLDEISTLEAAADTLREIDIYVEDHHEGDFNEFGLKLAKDKKIPSELSRNANVILDLATNLQQSAVSKLGSTEDVRRKINKEIERIRILVSEHNSEFEAQRAKLQVHKRNRDSAKIRRKHLDREINRFKKIADRHETTVQDHYAQVALAETYKQCCDNMPYCKNDAQSFWGNIIKDKVSYVCNGNDNSH